MKLIFFLPLVFVSTLHICRCENFDSELNNRNLNWSTVNDTVMGGRSSSIWKAGSFSSSVFKGYLSLENNGGFASVRHNVRNKNFSDESGIYLKFTGMEELINLESARNLQAGQTTTMNLKLRMIKSCLYFYHFRF